MADLFADSLLCAVIHVRLRRRKEPQNRSVGEQLEVLLEVRGKRSMVGALMRVNRGYEQYDLIEEFVGMGFGIVGVLPVYRNAAHPSVALWRLEKVGTDSTEDEGEAHAIDRDVALGTYGYKKTRQMILLLKMILHLVLQYSMLDARSTVGLRIRFPFTPLIHCCADIWKQGCVQCSPSHAQICPTFVRFVRIPERSIQRLSTV